VTGHLKVHLKPNERVYINGGVIRVDRKVTLELMNEVVFLIEDHILHEDDATTPMRQLYFIVQSMLMEPQSEPIARELYQISHQSLIETLSNKAALDGLGDVKQSMERGRVFEALRKIRLLFEVEDGILKSSGPASTRLATGRRS
jgi:flagellar protein FlbT